MKSKIITSEDVGQIVRRVGLGVIMDELIRRLESACRRYAPESTSVPIRQGFNYKSPFTGLVEWMPAMQDGQVTIKLVGYHPRNPVEHDLPTILSSIAAFDTSSGHLLGMVDGTFLTALRTGAASAVASRILAVDQAESVGIIGCGAQGLTQLHALSRFFPIRNVLYFDIDEPTMRSFPQRCAVFQEAEVSFQPGSAVEVVQSSDILCTATSVDVGCGPVYEDCPVRPHLHVNAIGSDFPGKTELPVDLLRRSIVCPDFREQARHEGECQQLEEEEIGPDLVMLAKTPERFREYRRQLTVFDSTGWALEDHVTFNLVLEYAEAFQLGMDIQLEAVAHDPKDPYAFLYEPSNLI